MAPAWQWKQADLIPWDDATRVLAHAVSPVLAAATLAEKLRTGEWISCHAIVSPEGKIRQERLSPEFWDDIELTPFEGGVRTTVRDDLMRFLSFALARRWPWEGEPNHHAVFLRRADLDSVTNPTPDDVRTRIENQMRIWLREGPRQGIPKRIQQWCVDEGLECPFSRATLQRMVRALSEK